MKNNKGFTLVELLAVIVILAIVIGIAVPSAITLSNKSKIKMYVTKVDTIMQAAAMYAQDNPSSVGSCIKVDDLVDDGKLKKDENIDPITNEDMGSLTLCIYKENNRYVARPEKEKCGDWEKNGAKLPKYC